MLRIAICNETTACGELFEKSIGEWAFGQKINIEAKTFDRGEEVLADIEQTGYFDIVLMDTVLKGNLSGIDTAKEIRRLYEYFCLIFVSGHNGYDNRIFDMHPFHYLEKPITKGKLFESLNGAVKSYRFLYETFVFRFNGINYCIRLQEVVYFVSDRRRIRICMENGREYIFYEKMDELEKRLRKHLVKFFRVHQSYLINGRQIEQYQYKYVVMRNRKIIPVSMDRRDHVEAFMS
ncbi:MAG: response regulator transcription factor [Lachnospiraceae bacterium]|nr:response regulator transcription factor [Lachnospiraceae bacterium]